MRAPLAKNKVRFARAEQLSAFNICLKFRQSVFFSFSNNSYSRRRSLGCRAFIRSYVVCMCVIWYQVYECQHSETKTYHQAWQMDSKWQVLVVNFIWGQKVKCQGRREFALFWVPISSSLIYYRRPALWIIYQTALLGLRISLKVFYYSNFFYCIFSKCTISYNRACNL